MFGYVTADMTRLSAQAKAEYKAAYCGLCRNLAKRYGAAARFLLQFDTTFLLLMLKDDGKTEDCVCPYRFCTKRKCLTCDAADYAADVTVLLACLKFEDDIKDEHKLSARILRRVYKKAFEKAKKLRPELYGILIRGITELERAEKHNIQHYEIPAGYFGQMMYDIFSYDKRLAEFGYYLGNFIYLCDAVCDFKSDIKHGRYNPLVSKRVSNFERILSSYTEKCLDILEDSGIESEIADNVLRYGVWLKYSLKYKRKLL